MDLQTLHNLSTNYNKAQDFKYSFFKKFKIEFELSKNCTKLYKIGEVIAFIVLM